MSAHDYLTGLLENQKLTKSETDSLQGLRKTVEDALREDFGTTPRLYYGGSYGKKTMIQASYDLDLVFYHPHDSTTAVKQIRQDVLTSFQDRNWLVEPKDVALRLYPEGKAFHVDVVPGRAIDATFKDAYLYRSQSDKRLKTSVKTHIDAVSTRRDLIRIMKLWRVRHSVHMKTFLLEQACMTGAKGKSLTDLSEQMWAALTWLRDSLQTATILDPANTANVLSDLPSDTEKLTIALQASLSLQQGYWKDIVW